MSGINFTNVEAAHTLASAERIKKMNADRTAWTLVEWTAYFSKGNSIMTAEEIAAATLWLTDKRYPVPADCPKRPEASPLDGGCPAFRPVCLTHGICPMARGMCGLVGDMAKCPTCGKEFNVSDLRDSLSKREFEISGMCQKCQDGVFGCT